ncbi:GPW/gp25 family protein [Myxococcota bacterium]|nr:GPW/gp25 family protein [Myxococcota bacterium]
MASSRPRHRALRFVHPDFDASEGAPGLRVGLGGGLEPIDGDLAVRQGLLMLLSTRPGERVMRPDYGCSLSELVFAPNDDTTAGLAIHYVRRAIERWEPRVEVLRIDAGRRDASPGPRGSDDGDVLRVWVEYRVRATLREAELVLDLPLQGGRR